MAGIAVTVKPEIISWILQTIQFDSAANSVIELLDMWRSGEKTPTFNQVEDVSKKINIPFGYFFLDKPPVEECPVSGYRTVKSLSVTEPSRNLIDILDSMTDIQEWMVNYVVENGQDELPYVGSAAGNPDIQHTTDDIRNKLGLAEEWYHAFSTPSESFKYIKNLSSDIGILVMMSGVVGNNTRRKLNVEEFRAFTLVNRYAPLIFINTCDSDTGKLFSIFHELAHVWLGVNSLYNDRNGISVAENGVEKICNAVSAEILAPMEIFKKQWGETPGAAAEKVETLAKYFKCSRFVMARRALDCRKITPKLYGEIITELTKQFEKWKNSQGEERKTGGNFYRTLSSKLDHRFVSALAHSAQEGRIQYTEVYRMTNTNRKTFSKLLDGIGGAGW